MQELEMNLSPCTVAVPRITSFQGQYEGWESRTFPVVQSLGLVSLLVYHFCLLVPLVLALQSAGFIWCAGGGK